MNHRCSMTRFKKNAVSNGYSAGRLENKIYFAGTWIVAAQTNALYIPCTKTRYTTTLTCLSCKDIVAEVKAGNLSQLFVISGHFEAHQRERDQNSQLHCEELCLDRDMKIFGCFLAKSNARKGQNMQSEGRKGMMEKLRGL